MDEKQILRNIDGLLIFFLCPVARGLQFKQPLGPGQNSRLMIFDENKEHPEPQELKESWAAPPTAKAKENEQKPDKWSNAKVHFILLIYLFFNSGKKVDSFKDPPPPPPTKVNNQSPKYV